MRRAVALAAALMLTAGCVGRLRKPPSAQTFTPLRTEILELGGHLWTVTLVRHQAGACFLFVQPPWRRAGSVVPVDMAVCDGRPPGK